MAQRPVIVKESAVHRLEPMLKAASVAGTRGDWLAISGGYVQRGTSSDNQLLGLLSADWTNDANHTSVDVEVDEHAIYVMDITNGPLVQATHVGNSYDLSDYRTLDLNATTKKHLTVVGITPGGRAICKLNKPF